MKKIKALTPKNITDFKDDEEVIVTGKMLREYRKRLVGDVIAFLEKARKSL